MILAVLVPKNSAMTSSAFGTAIIIAGVDCCIHEHLFIRHWQQRQYTSMPCNGTSNLSTIAILSDGAISLTGGSVAELQDRDLGEYSRKLLQV